MTVVATGSVAFDYIFTFKGRFGDQIVPGKTHMINLSFLVDTMEKRRRVAHYDAFGTFAQALIDRLAAG